MAKGEMFFVYIHAAGKAAPRLIKLREARVPAMTGDVHIAMWRHKSKEPTYKQKAMNPGVFGVGC